MSGYLDVRVWLWIYECWLALNMSWYSRYPFKQHHYYHNSLVIVLSVTTVMRYNNGFSLGHPTCGDSWWPPEPPPLGNTGALTYTAEKGASYMCPMRKLYQTRNYSASRVGLTKRQRVSHRFSHIGLMQGLLGHPLADPSSRLRRY